MATNFYETVVELLKKISVDTSADWTSTSITNLTAEVSTNNNKYFTVPADQEYQLLSLYTELTTGSTPGNRQITVRIEDSSGSNYGRYPVGATQAASLIRRYNHAVGATDLTAFRDTDKLSTPLPPIVLPAGFRVRILDSAGIDAAGDTLIVRALVMRRVL